MRKSRKPAKSRMAIIAIIVAAVYINVSFIVFAFRHSWMTKTERLLHIGDALTFSTVTKP